MVVDRSTVYAGLRLVSIWTGVCELKANGLTAPIYFKPY